MSLIKAYNLERVMMRTLGRAVRYESIDFLPYREEYKELKAKHVHLSNDEYGALLSEFSKKVLEELDGYRITDDDITFDSAIEEIIGYFALNGKDEEIPEIQEKTFDGIFLMSITYHGQCINAFRPKDESSAALTYGWNTFKTTQPLVSKVRFACQLNAIRNQAVEKYHVDCNMTDLIQILTHL